MHRAFAVNGHRRELSSIANAVNRRGSPHATLARGVTQIGVFAVIPSNVYCRTASARARRDGQLRGRVDFGHYRLDCPANRRIEHGIAHRIANDIRDIGQACSIDGHNGCAIILAFWERIKCPLGACRRT